MKTFLIILVVILVLLLIYFLITYNSLIKKNNKVKEAYSTMDVYLKQRWDLIPNILDTVKGYAKHEKDTLEKVILLRNGIYDNYKKEDKAKVNKEIDEVIPKLIAVSEDYPELKSNENFLNLQHTLEKVEDDIANSRKYYNACVRLYNNMIEMFPSNIIASVFKFKKEDMFEAIKEEKENVRIN